MPNENSKQAPNVLISHLQSFLKSYDYGCHMLDSLMEKHLSGEDIIPQICALFHDDVARAIFYLIRCSDEMAEAVSGSDLIDMDGHQKLADIRSKYRPILRESLTVGYAIAVGEINPVSSIRLGLSYEHDDESVRLDITGYSGQREIFRVVQDAVNFLDIVVTITEEFSDSFDFYQRQGLPLDEPSIKQLERLQKELQKSSAKLTKAVQNYLSSEKQAKSTTT